MAHDSHQDSAVKTLALTFWFMSSRWPVAHTLTWVVRPIFCMVLHRLSQHPLRSCRVVPYVLYGVTYINLVLIISFININKFTPLALMSCHPGGAATDPVSLAPVSCHAGCAAR